MLRVLKTGMLCSLQDLGRWGYRQYGVSQSGALDSFSHSLANVLLGNSVQAATLEITWIGAAFEFIEQGYFALCGADLGAELSGKALTVNRVYFAEQGQVLRFVAAKQGMRAYVAVQGGFIADGVLGSASSHLPSGMGSPRLQQEDILAWHGNNVVPKLNVFYPVPVYRLPVAVRALPGAEFTPKVLSRVFTVKSTSNRMALMLKGQVAHSYSEMYSSAVLAGTVQLPVNGEPMVLTADSQTTGGYARILQVIQADLPKVAQLVAGQQCYFVLCSYAEALQAWQEQKNQLENIKISLRYC